MAYSTTSLVVFDFILCKNRQYILTENKKKKTFKHMTISHILLN